MTGLWTNRSCRRIAPESSGSSRYSFAQVAVVVAAAAADLLGLASVSQSASVKTSTALGSLRAAASARSGEE